MIDSKLFTPYLYTSIEGGEYVRWTYGPIPISHLFKRDKSWIAIEDVHVHSFKFVNMERWDCVNGWTTPIPTWAMESISDERVEKINKNQIGIDSTLDERGKRYGKFTGHALIAQELKMGMRAAPKWDNLSNDQKEALEMIAHKIGRILNGDPDYHDSWHDIVGYAKLVADRLQGTER